MKKLSTIVMVALYAISLQAQKQVITSVSAGNFLSPTTWDCTCVPSLGSDIVIDHNVTLNTNFYLTGTLTINSGGALIQDVTPRDFLFAGSDFTNDGVFMVNRFYNSGGTLTNTGTLAITQSLYNTGILINDGSIGMLDSLLNDNILNVTADGIINSQNYTNNDSMVNNGRLIFVNYTNTGHFYNLGIIEADHMFNVGYFHAADSVLIQTALLNVGTLDLTASGVIDDETDFMNGDTLGYYGVINNDGEVYVGNNFTNTADIAGNEGSFCVANYSLNTGNILGTVDFCDQTPLSGPVNIDVNTGTIGTNVSSCEHVCTVTGIKEAIADNIISVYPNPFSGKIWCELSTPLKQGSFRLYDVLGNLVNESSVIGNNVLINTDTPAGLYYYSISDGDVVLKSGKIVCE